MYDRLTSWPHLLKSFRKAARGKPDVAALEERLAWLRLTIHPRAHPRPVAEGIPFLGFVVSPQGRRLKRRKGVHYERRLRRLVELYAAGEVERETVEASVQGWSGHVGYGNTVGLLRAVLRRTGFAPLEE